MASRTTLTKEKLARIKEGVLQGFNITEICRNIGVSRTTFNNWKNDDVLALDIKIINWQRELLLRKAERNFGELADDEDKRIKLDTSKFLAETLGKEAYSKQASTITNIILPTPIMDLGKLDSIKVDKTLIE